MDSSVTLSSVTPSDQDYILCKKWLEDSSITQWLTSTLRLAKYPRLIHDQLISSKTARLFFICLEDTPVGLIGLHNIDRLDKRAEVWYLIGEHHQQNKSVATNALLALEEWTINNSILLSLYAFAAESNKASSRVLTKGNFKQVGYFRNGFCLNGTFENYLIYDWIP